MKAAGDNPGKDHTEGLVDFLARFNASDQFAGIFKEGMGLVEETANYLDGPGRQDARLLDRTGAIAYATESMRITTDRKSTRLNSSHSQISYADFRLKKK